VSIAYEQEVIDSPNNAASSIASMAMGVSVNAGSTLVLCIHGYEVSGAWSVASVSDDQANTWDLAVATGDGSNTRSEIWVAHNCAAGSTTVTPSGSGVSSLYYSASVSEISTTLDGFELDTSGSNNQSTGQPTVTADATTSLDDAIIFGVSNQNVAGATNWTTPTGYTEIYDENDGNSHQPGHADYRIETTAAQETIDWTRVSGQSDNVIAVLAEASSGQTITLPSGIASAEAFGTAEVKTERLITFSAGVASAEAFETNHGVSTGAASQTITFSAGVATAEAFETDTLIDRDGILFSTSINTAEAFETDHRVGDMSIAPTSIASAEAFESDNLVDWDHIEFTSGIASAEAFETNHSVTAGTVPIVFSAGIASEEAFESDNSVGDFGITLASGIATGEAFETDHNVEAADDITFTASIASGEAFETDTNVATSSVTITFSAGVASAEAFESDNRVGDFVVTLASGIASAESVSTPIVDRDSIEITSGIASEEAFGLAEIGGGSRTITFDYAPHPTLAGPGTPPGGIETEEVFEGDGLGGLEDIFVMASGTITITDGLLFPMDDTKTGVRQVVQRTTETGVSGLRMQIQVEGGDQTDATVEFELEQVGAGVVSGWDYADCTPGRFKETSATTRVAEVRIHGEVPTGAWYKLNFKTYTASGVQVSTGSTGSRVFGVGCVFAFTGQSNGSGNVAHWGREYGPVEYVGNTLNALGAFCLRGWDDSIGYIIHQSVGENPINNLTDAGYYWHDNTRGIVGQSTEQFIDDTVTALASKYGKNIPVGVINYSLGASALTPGCDWTTGPRLNCWMESSGEVWDISYSAGRSEMIAGMEMALHGKSRRFGWFKGGALGDQISTGGDGTNFSLEGIIWNQGEEDGEVFYRSGTVSFPVDEVSRDVYYDNLDQLFRWFRENVQHWSRQDVPIVVQTLGRGYQSSAAVGPYMSCSTYAGIREAQEAVCAKDSRAMTVACAGSAMSDVYHYSDAAFAGIGFRTAHAMRYLDDINPVGHPAENLGFRISAGYITDDGADIYLSLEHNGGSDFTLTASAYRAFEVITRKYNFVESATKVDANTIKLTLATPLSSPCAIVRWFAITTCPESHMIWDNSDATYPQPLAPTWGAMGRVEVGKASGVSQLPKNDYSAYVDSTCTGWGTSGSDGVWTDSAADFVNDGVQPGMMCTINDAAGDAVDFSSIKAVTGTTLTLEGLSGSSAASTNKTRIYTSPELAGGTFVKKKGYKLI